MSREIYPGDTFGGASTDFFERTKTGGELALQEIPQAEEYAKRLPDNSPEKGQLTQLIETSKQGIAKRVENIVESLKLGLALLPDDFSFLQKVEKNLPEVLGQHAELVRSKIQAIESSDAQKVVERQEKAHAFEQAYDKMLKILAGSQEQLTDADKLAIREEKQWRVPPHTLSAEAYKLVYGGTKTDVQNTTSPVQFIDRAEINAAQAAQARQAKEAPTQVIPSLQGSGFLGRIRKFFSGK